MKKWALLLILFAIPLVGQGVEDVQQARIDSLEARLDSLVRTNNPIDLGERLTKAYEDGAAYGKRVINLMMVILAVVTLVLTVLGALGVWQGTRGNIKAEQTASRAESLAKELKKETKQRFNEITEIQKELDVVVKRLTRTDYMNQGFHYISQKRYDEALSIFEKAIELSSEDVEAWFMKGYCLGELDLYEEAVSAYERIIVLQPDYVDAHNNMGISFAKWGDTLEEEEAQDKYKQARASIEKAIRLSPNNPKAYNNLGLALSKLDRFDEAVKAYRKSISLYPEHADAYYNLGSSLNRWGDSLKGKTAKKKYLEALRAYTDAVMLEPEYVRALHGRALMFLKLKDFRSALDAFTRISISNPHSFDAHFGRGVAFGEMQIYEEAIAAYKEALRIQPDHAITYNSIAFNLMKLGSKLKGNEQEVKFKEARSEALKAIELSNGEMGYYNLACALSRLGDFEGALEELKAAKESGEIKEAISQESNPWEDPDLAPLRKPPYRDRFIEIVGEKPKNTKPKKK